MRYDVIIIGAGVSGAALATRLGQSGRRVLLLEKDLSPPQLCVGELLQPGGFYTLGSLHLDHVLQGTGAQSISGFAIIHQGIRQALPYPQKLLRRPGKVEGRAFHHGRFVKALRTTAMTEPNVDVQQGLAVELLEENGRANGITYRDPQGRMRQEWGRLLIAADGRHSRFRRNANPHAEPVLESYSVGVLLRDAALPFAGYGHVITSRCSSMLAYPISSNEIRVLVDVPGELPQRANGDLARYLTANVQPDLPHELKAAFEAAVAWGDLQVMPNYTLSPRRSLQPGLVVIGDAINMRHPVTGSGMTVALNDARILAELIGDVDLRRSREVDRVARQFMRKRRVLAVTTDMLSGALYQLFRADDPGLKRMRDAMVRYWQLGGPAVSGPMALLSGLSPKPSRLLAHYIAVALLGVGYSLKPTVDFPIVTGPDVRGASELATAALVAIRPQLRRALFLGR